MTEVEFDPPFDVVGDEQGALPMVFNSPHSGNAYPAGFVETARLSVGDLRRSADLYVDELLGGVLTQGIPLLRAHFPRCFLDVNREPYELDPSMFHARLPRFSNTRSARVQAGYGTVPRLVAEAHPIYRHKLDPQEALRRIDHYYLPYHATLRRLLSAAHRRYGYAVLIDWHSMPSAVFPRHRGVDIVLGDRHGASCAPELIDFVEHLFLSLGYTVQRNHPYAGGFITEHYGNPGAGLHALQIEINRALYMDEVSQQRHGGFGNTQDALMLVTNALASFESIGPSRIAAE